MYDSVQYERVGIECMIVYSMKEYYCTLSYILSLLFHTVHYHTFHLYSFILYTIIHSNSVQYERVVIECMIVYSMKE
jgi:hypothetical protein